jgi:iron complex outermembrane receptor protein
MKAIARTRMHLAADIFVCLSLTLPAAAQTLDYSTLEGIFHEPVTTSATGTPQRASDVPANMVILTRDDIRRSGALSIADVLAFIPGVDVRRYGIADYEVGIRGYNMPYNNRLLVLVNGRQVYLDDYGHVNWSTIPVQLEEIRQIEVIKGPNSALYGFNAVSGVINIITFDPLRDVINTAAVRGGTQSTLSGAVVGTVRAADRAGLRISIGGFRAADFAPGTITLSDAAARQNPAVGAFNIDARGRLAPGIEVFAEGSMSDTRASEKTFTGTFDTGFTRTDSLRAGITADTAIGLISANAYHNRQHVSVMSASLLPVANFVTTDTYVAQVSDLMKLGTDHTIRVGLEYRDAAASAPGYLRGTIGYKVYAVNAMWNWRITPELAWTNAVRIDDLYLRYSGSPAEGSGFSLADYNHANITTPSFNSGLVWHASANDTLRLMLARGVQLPSLVDFGLQFPIGILGLPLVVAGNPNVRPSTIDSVELDYDRGLPAIGSNLRAALFAERNRDLITQPFGAPVTFGPTGLPLLVTTNVGASSAIGGEVGLEGRTDAGLRWRFSYAFVTTSDDTVLNKGPVPTSSASYNHAVPRNVITAGIGYSRDRLELDLIGRWQSSFRDYQSTPGTSSIALQAVEVPNYFTFNARVGYRVTDHVTAALTLTQFNTSRLLQGAGPPVERQALVQVTATW